MRKTKKTKESFVVCVDNRGYEASLEAGKLYRMIPDVEAESHGYLRVIDESGEDYWYSAERFFRLRIPEALRNALWSTRNSGQVKCARSARTRRSSTPINPGDPGWPRIQSTRKAPRNGMSLSP